MFVFSFVPLYCNGYLLMANKPITSKRLLFFRPSMPAGAFIYLYSNAWQILCHWESNICFSLSSRMGGIQLLFDKERYKRNINKTEKKNETIKEKV